MPRRKSPTSQSKPKVAADKLLLLKATHVNTDQAPRFYASNIEVLVSVFDFKFKLGEVQEISPEKLVIKDIAVIAMSPQHALALADILNARLADYEGKFGKIPRPPGRE